MGGKSLDFSRVRQAPTLPPLSAAPSVIASKPFHSPFRLISPLTSEASHLSFPLSLSLSVVVVTIKSVPGPAQSVVSVCGAAEQEEETRGRRRRGKLPVQTENRG